MPWEHYTQEFATADPKELLPDCLFLTMKKQKNFLTFLGTQYQITWPDFEVHILRMIKVFITGEHDLCKDPDDSFSFKRCEV